MSTLAFEAMLTYSIHSTDLWHAQGYAGHVDLMEETALLQPPTLPLDPERLTCQKHTMAT